jgi:hypothetical protein
MSDQGITKRMSVATHIASPHVNVGNFLILQQEC